MKHLSPVLFGLCILMFFTPWITVSCQDKKVATATGVNLALGKQIEVKKGKSVVEVREREKVQEGWAMTALIFGMTGLITGVYPKRRLLMRIFQGLSGMFGALSLLFLRNKIHAEVVKKGRDLLAIDYHMGYYFAVLLYFLGMAFAIYLFFAEDAQASSRPRRVARRKSRIKGFYCPSCSVLNRRNARFCKNCGRKLK